MSDFESATSVIARGEGVFSASIPDGWQQGRGAFGGMVLGILARAMQVEVGADRRLRVLTGDLCGPAPPGDADVRVAVLRKGNRVSNVDAHLRAKGEVVARASGVFATARGSPRSGIAPTNEPGEWTAVAPIELGGFAPVFSQHYEYRATGTLPFSSGPKAIATGFVRQRVRRGALDAPALVGLLDAWWPAIFSVDAAPSAIATISFTAEILVDPASLPVDEPLSYVGRVIALKDGYFVEFRELFSRGELVAMNQQTFAILA